MVNELVLESSKKYGFLDFLYSYLIHRSAHTVSTTGFLDTQSPSYTYLLDLKLHFISPKNDLGKKVNSSVSNVEKVLGIHLTFVSTADLISKQHRWICYD